MHHQPSLMLVARLISFSFRAAISAWQYWTMVHRLISFSAAISAVQSKPAFPSLQVQLISSS
eukprot:10016588-Karenia_brevis.AAC.1